MRIELLILGLLCCLQGCRYSKPLFLKNPHINTIYHSNSSLRGEKVSYWFKNHSLFYKGFNRRLRYEVISYYDSNQILIRRSTELYVPGALDHWPPPGTRSYLKIINYNTAGGKIKAEYTVYRYEKKTLHDDIKMIVDKIIYYDKRGKKTVENKLKSVDP